MPGWSPPRGARRARARPEGSGRERGSATAELALALPVLVAVLALAVWAVVAVGAQVRCGDAAAAAARAAARGDDAGAVEQLARRLAPGGAEVDVREAGGQVEVVVRAQVRAPAVAAVLPPLAVTGRAVALREPGSP